MMMSDRPTRIQCRRTKGWKLPEGAIYVGRPTRWGNPFRIGEPFYRTAEDAVQRFKAGLTVAPLPHPESYMGRILTDIHLLRGKNLACWCPLDQPCHADILLEIANV